MKLKLKLVASEAPSGGGGTDIVLLDTDSQLLYDRIYLVVQEAALKARAEAAYWPQPNIT